MIIYNVTIKVEASIAAEWLEWMKVQHIPDVMRTGLFINHKMYKILEEEENEGVTYAIQYYCNTIADYNKYKEEFAAALKKETEAKYKNKFIAFRTLLEDVS